jgi:hypothetical protein
MGTSVVVTFDLWLVPPNVHGADIGFGAEHDCADLIIVANLTAAKEIFVAEALAFRERTRSNEVKGRGLARVGGFGVVHAAASMRADIESGPVEGSRATGKGHRRDPDRRAGERQTPYARMQLEHAIPPIYSNK